jgi:Domain of unknown function (DUF4407)
MAKRYLFSRLGGGDPKLLAEEDAGSRTGERTKFAAMGGVLLTTAGVAAVSMFFALHHAVGVNVGWSIPLALAWGLVIINIDRLLIITMGSTRGQPLKMAVTIFSRLVLAALIALVVATPLVLTIFHSDISAELPILAEQKSQQFKQSLANGADEKQLATITSEINAENAIVDGTGPSQVGTDQTLVNTLTGELNAAQSAKTAAYAKWQCEAGGLKGAECPPGTSGLVGQGPLANADEEAYDNDVQSYNTISTQLTAAETALSNAKKAAGQSVSAAETQLAKLKGQQTALQNKIAGLISSDDNANESDTGLLAQISALNAASAKNSGLAAARWTVTALFFIIEILPVTVKSLLMLGPESAYEEIVSKKARAAVDQADLTLAAETDAVAVRAQQIRDMAALEADHQRNTRAVHLQTAYSITEAMEQAKHDIETDMTRRDKGTRIEVNKRFASATREHILAGVDEWARGIRDKINKAMQSQSASPGQQQSTQGIPPPSANGMGPHTTVQNNPGYTMPSGGI